MSSNFQYAASRYLTILAEFVKYEWKLSRVNRFFYWFGGKSAPKLPSGPVQLRLLLEKLGGTFIKFGQIMAMRPDLLPPEYIDELSALFDNAPVFDSALATEIIERELKRPINEVFSEFEPKPLAAASFAQAHAATLLTGEKVVVKVQRPGLDRMVRTDLRFIRFLAALVDLSGIMKSVRVKPLVQDFVEWTNDELDYTMEASYCDRMRTSLNQNLYEYIPKIYWDFCAKRIITLERLEGFWISDILAAIKTKDDARLRAMEKDGLDLKAVAFNLFNAGLHQAFEEEVFHADPHAGNLVVLKNNQIGYIDFGIVGQLGDRFRDSQITILNALEQGNLDRYVNALMRLFNPAPANVDVEAFQEEVKKNARRWLNTFYNPKSSLRERSSAFLLTKNLGLARQYGLSYAQVAVRYYRALFVAELIVLRLDPSFDLRMELRGYFTRFGFRAIAASRAPDRFTLTAMRSRQLFLGFPEMIADLFEVVSREVLIVRTEVSTFRSAAAQLFMVVAIVVSVAFVTGTVWRFAYPTSYQHLFADHGLPWSRLLLIALLVVPLCAWLSRLLFIYRVRRGSYVKNE